MEYNQSSQALLPDTMPESMANMTSPPEDPDSSEVYVIIRRIQTCVLPLICLFGLLANSLAIRTFLSGKMRKSSCSIYLAAKCLSDNGFLVATFIIWSFRFKVPLFNLQGVCQMTVFLTYLCSFLSVWLMAIITCENYIRIAHSFWVSSCCTATRAYIVIAILTIVAVLLNMFHLWTTSVIYIQSNPRPNNVAVNSGNSTYNTSNSNIRYNSHIKNNYSLIYDENANHNITQHRNYLYFIGRNNTAHYNHRFNFNTINNENNYNQNINVSSSSSISYDANTNTASATCMSLIVYQDLLITMTYVDTVLTLLLPSIFMFVLVVIILKNVLQSTRRRKRLRAGTQRAHGIRRTVTPQAKMTRFLLAVSLIFIILHTPSHVIRIKMTIAFYVFEIQPSVNDRIVHRVFELLYNLNFCNNCVIYLVFGENFRQAFYGTFCEKFKQKKDRVLSQFDRHEYVQSEMTELVANPS